MFFVTTAVSIIQYIETVFKFIRIFLQMIILVINTYNCANIQVIKLSHKYFIKIRWDIHVGIRSGKFLLLYFLLEQFKNSFRKRYRFLYLYDRISWLELNSGWVLEYSVAPQRCEHEITEKENETGS